MGGAASRATAQQSAEAAQQRLPASHIRRQQAIDRLPRDSAVLRDIVAAQAAEEERIAQEKELDGVPMEVWQARDDTLVQLMSQTMTREDGRIEYREHLLPMQEGALAHELVSSVRAPSVILRLVRSVSGLSRVCLGKVITSVLAL